MQLIDGLGYPAAMAEDFRTSRANLSNHLTCLRECGLVTPTAEGRRVRYDLADQRLVPGVILVPLDAVPETRFKSGRGYMCSSRSWA